MTIQRIGINQGKEDGSAPHTAQIVVDRDRIYFTATPDKPYSPNLDIGEQTQQALDRIDRRLARAGSDKSRLLTVAITISDPAGAQGMNAIWNRWVSRDHPPARICTIGRFTKPHIRVEMTVCASIGGGAKP